MGKKILSALSLCFVLISLNIAQEAIKPLTNADVVEMSKAGLPGNTIILAIQKGPTSFDTSPQTLIQLKNQGVGSQVLDAMIQAGSAPPTSSQTTATSRHTNADNHLSSGDNLSVPSPRNVYLIDGSQRVLMKYSTTDTRTNSGLGAFVNPLHKTRFRAALSGNHAPLRTKNTSPMIEVTIASDANPTDIVTLVKLKPKSETREIETYRGSITGVSGGFRKEDRLALTLEEVSGSTSSNQKIYKVKLINPLVPGEYALVYGSAFYYDFGVDAH